MSQDSVGKQLASAGREPTGVVQMYAGSTIPSGWMDCDGSAISRTTYAKLFAIIGTTFGTGDGSTTFNIPNLKGRVPMGSGTGAQNGGSGSGAISGGTALTARSAGAWGGAEGHQLTLAQMPSHRHALNAVSSLTQTGSAQAAGATGTPAWGVTDYAGGSSAGSNGDSHNNVQPFLVLKFIIKY